MVGWKQLRSALMLGILVTIGSTATAVALQSSSAHFGVDETQFGSGSLICDPGTNGSAHYCANQTLGDTATGNSASANFQVQAGGLTTDRDNSLQIIVNPVNTDIGQLTTTNTKTTAASFSVLSYLASGYAVYTDSVGPQYSTHVLNPLSSATASATGTEQFGINLVANACPANTLPSGPGNCSGTLGADPTQAPDSSFSHGFAAPGYDTPNSYKYVNGDIIAASNSSSGETDYTISYLFNISAITPAGTYTMHHVLVATSTF